MKNFIRHQALLFFVIVFSLLAFACEDKYFAKPPLPKAPVETSTLEASFVSSAPMTLTDAYWKSADYLRVPVADLNKNALYSDGFLNMTNTFAGLSSFNKGNDPKVVMKAAYDNKTLYIYAEWIDSDGWI